MSKRAGGVWGVGEEVVDVKVGEGHGRRKDGNARDEIQLIVGKHSG